MSTFKKIQRALISVYHKDGLIPLARTLAERRVQICSTGGTADFIATAGFPVTTVEEITEYPSIFEGRVKTLHPKIFGGVLCRPDNAEDLVTMKEYNISSIDLVIVDLYPFEEEVGLRKLHTDIIEKIDIGGVSLIRAAAKNYEHVLVISHQGQYRQLQEIVERGHSTFEERMLFAREAFKLTAALDSKVAQYFADYHTSKKI